MSEISMLTRKGTVRRFANVALSSKICDFLDATRW